MIREGNTADLVWMGKVLAECPEAAQWLPEHDPFLVAEPEGGFLVWRRVADGEFEILNLAVAPRWRQQGIGRALVATATARGGRWFLEVRESNVAARRLYEGAGFRESGRRRSYYRDPVEDAVMLSYEH